MFTITVKGEELGSVQAIADYAVSEIVEATMRYDHASERTQKTINRIGRDYKKRARRMHQDAAAISQQWEDIKMLAELELNAD